MAPKTKSRTGIWFFAKERMDNGRVKASSVREAIEGLYPEWKAMVAHEKAPYEKMCEQWRHELKLEKNIFVKVKKDEMYEMDDEIKEQEDLAKLLSSLSSVKREDGRSMDGIKEQHWYFIQFQTFCKSDVNPDPDHRYNPYFVLAEVAIIEYSLKKGIVNEYHSFIKPNKIPLGYTSQCMDKSKEDHQIPLYSFDKLKKTYTEIYNDIKRFTKQYSNNEVPVFCMNKDLEATRFALKFLYNNTPSHEIFPFNKVYTLENLVVNLAKYCSTEYSFESAHDLLTSYAFDYTPNSRCDYHEDLCITHCSLGLVKKYSYLISDNICQFYDIDLTDNHIPVQKSVGTIIYNSSNNSHRNSVHSLSSSRSSSKRYIEYRDEDADNQSDTISYKSNNRNMPATDIRKRQLVSDKLEMSANMSSISSSINTTSKSRYNQYYKENGNNYEVESFVSDSIDTNISSTANRFQNADAELLEEDEEDGTWTKVEKHSRPNKDSMSVISDRTSNLTAKSSNVSSMNQSSQRSFRGRGRAFSKGID